METNYYIYGKRPVIEEITKHGKQTLREYHVFEWETGKFIEDISYIEKIFFDPSGDSKSVSKGEFDSYVANLKRELGLP